MRNTFSSPRPTRSTEDPATVTRPSRRTIVASTLAVALGATMIGGLSTAAYADEPSAAATPALLTAQVKTTTIAPFVSIHDANEATEPDDQATDEAADALKQAEDALSEAEATTADVSKADVDVDGEAKVDTTQLEEHIDGLTDFIENPELLVQDVTDDTRVATASVIAATTDLRTRLAEAKKKAAEEAARKAAEEAARKAAEEAAASRAASSSSSSSGSSASLSSGSAASSGDNSVAGAKATAKALLSSYGWGSDQFSCLERLWNRESGWNYKAYNSSSGAYGIPQALPGSKMASAGSNWKTSAATQIKWGLGYISGRYSTPCGAWSHSQSTGWY